MVFIRKKGDDEGHTDNDGGEKVQEKLALLQIKLVVFAFINKKV